MKKSNFRKKFSQKNLSNFGSWIFLFNPNMGDVRNHFEVWGRVAASPRLKQHYNLPKLIKFNLKWRLTSNRDQKNQGKSAKNWTWLPSWNFLTISKKKFTKQIILVWNVFIEPNICNLYHLDRFSSQKIEILS